MSSSPCINICRIDPASGLCCGCLRTLAEIAAWATMDEAARAATLAEVARRRAAPTTTGKRDA